MTCLYLLVLVLGRSDFPLFPLFFKFGGMILSINVPFKPFTLCRSYKPQKQQKSPPLCTGVDSVHRKLNQLIHCDTLK